MGIVLDQIGEEREMMNFCYQKKWTKPAQGYGTKFSLGRGFGGGVG